MTTERAPTGETKRRTVRVPDDTWLPYLIACNSLGIVASADLRQHMEDTIEKSKGAAAND